MSCDQHGFREIDIISSKVSRGRWKLTFFICSLSWTTEFKLNRWSRTFFSTRPFPSANLLQSLPQAIIILASSACKFRVSKVANSSASCTGESYDSWVIVPTYYLQDLTKKKRSRLEKYMKLYRRSSHSRDNFLFSAGSGSCKLQIWCRQGFSSDWQIQKRLWQVTLVTKHINIKLDFVCLA